MKRILFIILIILSVNSFGQTFKKTATAGFTFLNVPATARTAALGEASISLTDLNSDAVFHNPGALGFSESTHFFAASYSPWFAEIKNYASSFLMKTRAGVFGLGFIMMDYGDMPRTVISSGQKVYDVIGTFNASSIALGVSYSKRLTDKFSFGVTVKYVNEKIDVYSANNFLFDGGVIYKTGFGSLRIAALIQNFGTNSKFINDNFKMPATMRIGASGEIIGDYNSKYRLTLLVEAVHPNDADERINVGSELAWKETIILRAGYKFFYDEESYSFGFGLIPKLSFPVKLDISYSDYGKLEDVFRFTLQLGIL